MKTKRFTYWVNHQVTTVFAVECKSCAPYSEKFQKARNFLNEQLGKRGHKLLGSISLAGNMYLITDITYSLENNIIKDVVESLEKIEK